MVALAIAATLFGAGLLVVVVAVCLCINTSIGGTRSDHDDGSDTLFGLGAAIMVCAIPFLVWGLTQ